MLKLLAIAAATLAGCAAMSSTAQAGSSCPAHTQSYGQSPGGGNWSGSTPCCQINSGSGYDNYYACFAYVAPAYVAPAYVAPTYVAPTYVEPVYQAPVHAPPAYKPPAY